MEQFVRYLFEYKENQRIRNTGFVKVQKDESKTLVHIHGQGFRFVSEQKMMVYVYEMEGDIPVGIYQGEIGNINPSIHYILTYSPEDIGDAKEYEKICGIILRTESGRIFAASWNDMPFNAGEMIVRTEEMKELEPTFTEAMVQEVIQDAEDQKDDCGREEHSEEEMYSEAEKHSEAEHSREKVNCEAEVPCEAEKRCEREAHEEEDDGVEYGCPSVESERTEEIHSEKVDQCEQQSSKLNVRRITRQDIALLPRCEWRLANNSFLLHGYYNYHYLVLIEEEEGLWLGVPGVYHKREEKAAQNFGFSSFLKVSDEEKEPFGYWCRKVRQRIQR